MGQSKKYYYKINWLNLLIKFLKKKIKTGESIIVCGDFNIIPEENDVYAPEKYTNDALFRIEIRKKYRELINMGFSDVFRNFNKEKGNYTFWDYQKGSWRKNNGLRINNEVVTDETKIIDKDNFDQDNNMKVSHGKKQHVIVKIIQLLSFFSFSFFLPPAQ